MRKKAGFQIVCGLKGSFSDVALMCQVRVSFQRKRSSGQDIYLHEKEVTYVVKDKVSRTHDRELTAKSTELAKLKEKIPCLSSLASLCNICFGFQRMHETFHSSLYVIIPIFQFGEKLYLSLRWKSEKTMQISTPLLRRC